ncbi:MAG: hypothetical protein ACYTE6_09330 [Planctomycetota bacterium]|jgi:hypothetical protein
MRPLTSPRPLNDLEGDDAGQAVTEWAMLLGVVVIPLILLIPWIMGMIYVYFYRVAESISLPFP